jgi:hypothetical protein
MPFNVSKHTALLTIKAGHTLVWAFFAGCIFAIPALRCVQTRP